MPLYGMHEQTGRAQSFGSWAEEYDRYRLDYPDALAEDLLATRPAAVLDVACGTGKAAVLLASHGANVLGVEPDERMAAFARSRGIPVEVARFEEWDDRGRRFDLITCASAWHWLDPAVAATRIPALLNPGGVLARFWPFHVFGPEVLDALDGVYARMATDLESFGHDPTDETEPPDPLREVDALEVLPSRTYRWWGRITADEWVGRIATYTGHQRLGPERLRALQAEVRSVIDGFGGTIDCHFGTLCLLARRRASDSASEWPR